MRNYIFFPFFFIISFVCQAQELGIPFIRNFLPKEYAAETQNWCISQSPNGLLYVGNGGGLLEYDGNRWKRYPLPNRTVLRSMAWDKTGKRLYTGGEGEIGYFENNIQGTLTYTSFLSLLDSNSRKDMADVWTTEVVGDAVYFHCYDRLIRVDKGKAKVWKPEDRFRLAYASNNRLYLLERGKGLCILENDIPKLLPQGEVFKDDIISGMITLNPDTIFIVSRKQGLFYYIPKTEAIVSLLAKTEIPLSKNGSQWAEVNQWIVSNILYHLALLPNGHIVATSSQNGILIFDQKGQIIQTLNKKSGLESDIVRFAFSDKQHNLWIGTDNGITRLEKQQPISRYTDAEGLNGSIYTIYRYKETVFVGTGIGLFALRGSRWEQIEGIKNQVWSISSTPDGRLWIGTTNGLYEYKNGTAHVIKTMEGRGVFKILSSQDTVFLGMGEEGVDFAYKKDESWLFATKKFLNTEIRSLANDSLSIWAGSRNQGIYRLQNGTAIPYDTLSGLPTMNENQGYFYNHRMLFATQKGFYRFIPANSLEGTKQEGKFIADTALNNLTQSNYIGSCRLDKKGNLWYFDESAKNIKIIRGFVQGNYQIDSLLFKRLPSLGSSSEEIIYLEENGIAWIGGSEGLFRYDPTISYNNQQPFTCLLRHISYGDSVLFDGAATVWTGQIIPHSKHQIQFRFSAPYMVEEGLIQYQCFLEGYDEEWSVWHKNTEWLYTNLPEGKYIFKVKARNIYGVESNIATYSFKVLPPWYQSWWAYLGYLLLAVLLVFGIVRFFTARIRQQKRLLENIVRERTEEIRMQSEELQITLETVNIQKEEITHIHQNIQASINYAARIQSAILPFKERITAELPENFILFKPRDVVSGDFYWFEKIENKLVLAVADCTGHGVPGAFMSMIGNQILAEAVLKNRMTESESILIFCNKEVVRILKQNETANRDGMDMVLVIIDQENQKMQFSGAKNPLFYVQNAEMKVIKASSFPVGGSQYDLERTYPNHEIRLSNPLVFYLFTDGFQDQFGGEKNKKFMTKRFRELLFEISQKPMPEQGEILEKTFDDWIAAANEKQTDDMTILGIRIG